MQKNMRKKLSKRNHNSEETKIQEKKMHCYRMCNCSKENLTMQKSKYIYENTDILLKRTAKEHQLTLIIKLIPVKKSRDGDEKYNTEKEDEERKEMEWEDNSNSENFKTIIEDIVAQYKSSIWNPHLITYR